MQVHVKQTFHKGMSSSSSTFIKNRINDTIALYILLKSSIKQPYTIQKGERYLSGNISTETLALPN